MSKKNEFRVAAVGYNVKIGRGKYRFRERVKRLVRQLAGKARVIVFPEYLGMDMTDESIRLENLLDDTAAFYQDYIQIFTELAKKYKTYILAGTTVEPLGRHYYNTSHLFTPSGEVIKYRKIHLHGMDKDVGFRPGKEPVIVEVDGVKMGMEVCYDLGFPELARLYALRGAIGILAPAQAPGYGAYKWLRYCAHSRAIENQGFTVLAAGTLSGLPIKESYGIPAILVTTDYDREGVLGEDKSIALASINMDRLLRIRAITPAPVLNDMRKELISGLLREMMSKKRR
jgi:predicted amidohydrolase